MESLPAKSERQKHGDYLPPMLNKESLDGRSFFLPQMVLLKLALCDCYKWVNVMKRAVRRL